MTIKPILIGRHTTKAGADGVTGASGDLRAMMADSPELRLHDGSTAGGRVLGRGGWRYVREQSVSGAAQLDIAITAADLTFFREFRVVYEDITVATDDAFLRLRLGQGAGPTYSSGVGAYIGGGRLSGPGGGTDYGTGTDSGDGSYIPVQKNAAGNGIGNAAGENYNGEVRLRNPGSASMTRLVQVDGVYIRPDGSGMDARAGFMWGSSATVTAVRLYTSTGNLSGKAVLLGRRS